MAAEGESGNAPDRARRSVFLGSVDPIAPPAAELVVRRRRRGVMHPVEKHLAGIALKPTPLPDTALQDPQLAVGTPSGATAL